MKKLKFIVSVVLIFSLLLVGCSAPAAKPSGSSAVPAKKFKVALCLGAQLGDRAICDTSYAGIKQAMAEWPDVESKVLEAKSPSDWEPNLLAAASGGYDLVFVTAANQKDIIKKISPQFPNVKFACIDGVVKLPNIMSALFAQNEGSFLAGAAAAMYTTKTNIPGVNPEKIVGWVGGQDNPILADFFGGYKQGAEYVDPDVKVLRSFAGSFSDPLKGKEMALAQYSQGADIVMAVAAATGAGILEASAEAEKYSIGVDLNQDDQKPGHILTSMLKNANMATYNIIKEVRGGNFKGGEVYYMNLANGGVGLTDFATMKKALGDKFPQEILVKLEELKKDIISGKIKVVEQPGVR